MIIRGIISRLRLSFGSKLTKTARASRPSGLRAGFGWGLFLRRATGAYGGKVKTTAPTGLHGLSFAARFPKIRSCYIAAIPPCVSILIIYSLVLSPTMFRIASARVVAGRRIIAEKRVAGQNSLTPILWQFVKTRELIKLWRRIMALTLPLFATFVTERLGLTCRRTGLT